MYSRRHSMPRPRGGITGFGYGNSLGGLLVGGVYTPVSKLTPEEYRERLEKAAAYRAKRKQEGYVPAPSALKGRTVRPTRGPRYGLANFMDAEIDAADLEYRMGNKKFANELYGDYAYNENLYDSKKIPKWLRDKYTKQGDWYSSMARAKRALEGAREFVYTSSSGKKTVVKEGSATFDKYAAMKRVREDPSLLRPLGEL